MSVGPFTSDIVPANWVAVGPIKPRSLEKDYLAALGGASNVVLKAGQEIAYRSKKYPVRRLGTNEWFKDGTFTAGLDAIDVSAVVGRKWKTTAYFYTVLELDSDRALTFNLLSPGGVLWNTRSRLDAKVWFAGRPIEERTVMEVSKGRYPLMLQVGVGKCEEWGKIWMAPRFVDVTKDLAEQRRAYDDAMTRWPEYVAAHDKLFVLGE